MALVKTSTFAAGAKKPSGRKQTGADRPAATTVSSPQQPPVTRYAKASERVAAATEELASGLTEAAAAAEELRRAMKQIATGAEEAAGASQEQLAAIVNIVAGLVLVQFKRIPRNVKDTTQSET